MKINKNLIGVSNLSWNHEDSNLAFAKLRDMGIKYIEVAPTKVCDWVDSDFFKKIKDYKILAKKYDIEICGLQSLFFNKSINLFKEPKLFLEHFKVVIKTARILEAKYLVYGSPKTRVKTENDDESIFVDIFCDISELAKDINVCIEPNPLEYGCNFILNASECEEMVRKINKKNIKSHIDTSSIILNKESINFFKSTNSITAHISAPFLKNITNEYKSLYNNVFDLDLEYITLEVVGTDIDLIEEQVKMLKQ
jgi:D-psicose/D-tagatose/L-ribulose 3-epimerase